MLDRADRRGALGRPFAFINATRGRRPQDRASRRGGGEEDPKLGGRVAREICPAAPGGKDWQPSAYSPRTGLLYMPHNNLCMDFQGVRGQLHRRHAVRRRQRQDVRRPGRQPRRLHRLGPGRRASRAGRSRSASRPGAAPWRPPATWSSTAPWRAGSRRSTRGTGRELWKFKTGSGIIGQPVTYTRAGRQAVRRRPLRRRRLVRRHRGRQARSARRHRRARLPGAMADLPQHTTARRQAVCVRAALRPWRRDLQAALRAGPGSPLRSPR